jgi:hypothetical protein
MITLCKINLKKLKDVCWYDYDDVLAVIPEPTPVAGWNQ